MSDLSGLRGRLSDIKVRLARALFGDRLGFTVFLVTVCLVSLFWRTGVFINDNETLIATLDALADGRLWIDRVGDGPVFDAPGAEIRDGRVYGRNYGQVVFSLPALALVRLIDLVADLRTGLVALWHLIVLGLFVQLGQVFDRCRIFAVGGSVVVLAFFCLNLVVLTPISTPSPAHLALQMTTVAAAGFVAVVLYRLVSFEYDQRLGVLVGLGSVLVAPVGFWATIPKRHVFSVLACVGILYLFARSRVASSTTPLRDHLRYRGGAYALVGMLTWIHAAEGLFVCLALVAVDLPTAPRNDRQTLSALAGIFALSLVPVVLTNALVTGSVVRPPRLIARGEIQALAVLEPVGNSVSTAGLAVPGRIAGWLGETVLDLIAESLAVVRDPERLFRIVVRSSPGDLEKAQLAFEGTNLSVLESMPVLGLTAVAALSGVRSLWNRRAKRPSPPSLLAGAMIVAFVLLYLSRLPLHVQVTQRYLLPVYPLALYLLVSSGAVRELCSRTRTLLWSYSSGVLLGGQLFVVYLLGQELAITEAAQLHARLALVSCLSCAVLGTIATISGRGRRVATAAIGFASAVGTLFLVVGGVYYFTAFGDLLIAVVDVISDRLVLAR